MFFNPVFPNALFIYPLKTSENLKMARVVNLKWVFGLSGPQIRSPAPGPQPSVTGPHKI